jgi:hypothetical protein
LTSPTGFSPQKIENKILSVQLIAKDEPYRLKHEKVQFGKRVCSGPFEVPEDGQGKNLHSFLKACNEVDRAL